MEWRRGERLQDGKYTIRDVLGKGGFGITYRVRDLEGRQFVIKTLNEEAQASQDFDKLQQDFMNEALRLVQFKKHPHIVKVYQLLQEPVQKNNVWNRLFNFGSPPASFFLCFILMEYIEGTDLQSYVNKRGGLPEAEALQYIQQVGDALTAMHQEELLHRDVKPSNIVLRASNSQAVLIDFGLARNFGIDRSPHTISGTLSYCAFEQFDPTVAEPGEYTDVYALAATLYSLVTGKLPTSAMARSINAPLKPPKQIVPNLSDRVHNAIIKGMELLPQNRPQSVQDWLKLLASPFPGFPLIPRPFPVPPPAPQPDNLRSTVGMDYKKLRDLLAAGKWREADEETAKVMLKVAGRETYGWLDTDSIKKFPCQDLRTIDQLWVKYSNGRFGFSVQKRIWLEVGGKPGEFSYEVWYKFGDRVGWRINDWIYYDDLTFSVNAPGGHLPIPLWVWGKVGYAGWVVASSLAQRLVNCNI
ncbi:MAG TPA: serine/threonine protein kinase [Cyanobacteria bacterium UBA11369]|nr:serine/threonine protein kinase [Cyanobacteria bacterium UBA11371]HBE36548.1 serine/threonine protein kinase [Cyanobacteria bacterium UBA11368]HBE47766.1 serine/threonine protein kinase [Cyanobacteria bacterium UBA11369]